jgi:hypothetical protein
VLISYGLRYNFQQRIIQQTFRKAMAKAVQGTAEGKPTQVSYVAIRDEYVPDPSNPFAVGSVMPVMSSASVTSSYRLQDAPVTPEELPQLVIDVNGQQSNLTVARYRTVWGGDDAFKKYVEIYGAGSVRKDEQSGSLIKLPLIIILDPLLGDIVDYDTAKRICDMLTIAKDDDSSTADCYHECQKTRLTAHNCPDREYGSICATPIPATDIPIMCSKLNDIFMVDPKTKRPTRTLGLQQDYRQETSALNTLTKREDRTGISTTDNLGWTTQIYRPVRVKGSDDSVTPYTITTTVEPVEQAKKQEMKANW